MLGAKEQNMQKMIAWRCPGISVLSLLLQLETRPCCKWPWPVLGVPLVLEGVQPQFMVTLHNPLQNDEGAWHILLFSLLSCLEDIGVLGNEKANVIQETRKLLPVTVFRS